MGRIILCATVLLTALILFRAIFSGKELMLELQGVPEMINHKERDVGGLMKNIFSHETGLIKTR
jgi:hypothetical protein